MDTLTSQFISVENFIESDRIYAFEFYAKGGKKMIVDLIRECDRMADNKKWYTFNDNQRKTMKFE
jgi:hypothetical protein